MFVKIGVGQDTHRLVEGRKLILGGVHIPYEKGLLGHSDADVLSHAIADAILGALGESDIGEHFPPSDPTYKDADSIELLRIVAVRMQTLGYVIGNIDATVTCEKPKLGSYREQMEKRIAEAVMAAPHDVNVKFTTCEGLGAIGRGEGIEALATVLIYRLNTNPSMA